MKRFFRSNECGAVPAYVAGVLVLAVLLVGGVMLLKNIGGSKPEIAKPTTVESGEFKADDNPLPDETKTETETADTAAPATVTDAKEEHAPEKLTATGPTEDFLLAIVGLTLAGITAYTAHNYARSRKVVKMALLRK